MKKIICGWVMAICLFLIIGIIGGVDCGEPITNMYWCVPLFTTLVISGYIGEF